MHVPKLTLKILWATGNRVTIFIATFFLGKKSSQKSQDGGILSAHKAFAGPVRRHSSPPRTYNIQFLIENLGICLLRATKGIHI